MKKILLLLLIISSFLIFQNNVSADNKTEALKNKIDYRTDARKCWRLSWWDAVYWTPSKKYFDAVKTINTKLQELRDKWQNTKDKTLNDAYSKLAIKSLAYTNKCLYSWLIDSIENQPWYWKYHKVKNWVITVWVDFWSYKDKLSEIDNWNVFWSLFQLKNSATKIREYKLAKTYKLQSLYLDSKWFATNSWEKKYLNNFDSWLNTFCKNEKIYTKQEWTWINWNKNNVYCVKNRLKSNKLWMDIQKFWFDSKWEIEKIDLDRRWLSNAN